MRKRRARRIWAAAAVAAAAVAIVLLRPRPGWIRERPLAGAIAVAEVSGGRLLLEDGRWVAPAGIRWRADIEPSHRDEALRVATAQGLVIDREFDDGRVLATVEPKFYNWCGTCRRRYLGVYARAPLSEMLIYTGYAEPSADGLELTSLERWRLEGALKIHPPPDDTPRRISDGVNAFERDGAELMMHDYDFLLECSWKPPPQPASDG